MPPTRDNRALRHYPSFRRLPTTAGWSDLALPERVLTQLREIAVRARRNLRRRTGTGTPVRRRPARSGRVLFVGHPGTGKTLAAQVLAGELRLPLYRIDLAAVVSKYIGETEKNLRQLFDAAGDSNAILFFDEADALFGKRSKVKDSHDRYANIDFGCLLQRIEQHRGLLILATNLKSALDPAFMRRMGYIVQFPRPRRARRTAI